MQLPNKRFAAVIFAAIVASNSITTALAGLKVGSAFPELASFKLEGQLPADLKGKIVMVDFWASWCGPCKQSFPIMDELQKRFGPQGLVIIAINEDEKKSGMDRFLKEKKVAFTVVRDAAPDGKKLVDKADVSSMPSSFIMDATGTIRFMHTGFNGDETKRAYEKEIESLLKK